MVEKVFLTEARRKALKNYDPDNSNHRAHKSRVAERARVALEELLWVASNLNIDNADVFDEETVRALLTELLVGNGGVITEEDVDYRNSVYVAISRAQMNVERNSDPGDIYEMFGEEAKALREFDSEKEID